MPDDPRLVTGQQGSPPPRQQLSGARTVCAGGSGEGSTKLKHGTKLGRTLARHDAKKRHKRYDCAQKAAAGALSSTGRRRRVVREGGDGGRRRPGAPGRVPGRTTLGRTGGRSPGTCGERASGGRSRMESASMLYQGSSQPTRARPAQHRRGKPAHGPRTGETPPQNPPPANRWCELCPGNLPIYPSSFISWVCGVWCSVWAWCVGVVATEYSCSAVPIAPDPRPQNQNRVDTT